MGIKNRIKSLFPFKDILFEDRIHINELRKKHFCPIEETENQDIFIAGFPKSGNTWMQNLLAGIVYGIDTQYLPDKLTQELVPDVHGKAFYKRFLPFCCFKTHELPKANYKRVIHLVRDGRDAMVSYHAMNKAMGMSISLEEMIIEGKGVYPCKWHEHTRQWFNNPYNAEIITVKYEDLLATPEKEMKRICYFIGIDRTLETIRMCINGSSFHRMQEKERVFGWDNINWDSREKFVRKGRVGSYLSEMPFHLQHYFDNESSEMLEKYGYEV